MQGKISHKMAIQSWAGPVMKHPFFFIARHGVYPALSLTLAGSRHLSISGRDNLPLETMRVSVCPPGLTTILTHSSSIAMTVSILSGGHPHPMPRCDNRKKSASCHPPIATTIYQLRDFAKTHLYTGANSD